MAQGSYEPSFEIRGSSEVRQQMQRIRSYIYQIIDWYDRLGFKEIDIVNEWESNPFPQELWTELKEHRNELSSGDVRMRNKALEFIQEIAKWRANISDDALDRMEYFAVTVPWEAIDNAIKETQKMNSKKTASKKKNSLLAADIDRITGRRR
jgi:hypothetical protein